MLPKLCKKVLLVEDEASIRELLEHFFKACACKVDLAVNGAEALQMAMFEDYDVIVSDLRMPRMTGLEFHEALMRERPDFGGDFLFVSGELGISEYRESVAATGRPFLLKPFLPSEILGFLTT